MTKYTICNFFSDQIDVITNFAVITNVVIKLLYKSASVNLLILQVPILKTMRHLTQGARKLGRGIHVLETHFFFFF